MAVGPCTSAIETGATTIGAGMLIGGFIVGLVGLAVGPRRMPDSRGITRASPFGGLLAIAVALGELSMT